MQPKITCMQLSYSKPILVLKLLILTDGSTNVLFAPKSRNDLIFLEGGVINHTLGLEYFSTESRVNNWDRL